MPYTLLWDDDTPYRSARISLRRTRTGQRVARDAVYEKDNSTSVYRHYLNCCEALGLGAWNTLWIR